MPDASRPPGPARETTYDVDALREAYGDVRVVDRTYEKADASAFVDAADRDALGGAGVVVRRERDGAILYVDVRADDATWDVPGGGREPGESPEATAVREVHEEVGLAVELDDVACAYRLAFDDGERTPTGIWVRFTASVSEPGSLDLQRAEIADATWRRTRPDDVDALLAHALDELDVL